jgi:hypothetical protein
MLLACLGLPLIALATDTGSALPNGNTADGTGVLVNLTTGVWNSGFGFYALNHDTSGGSNTATGLRALSNDTTGSHNTATGVYALYSNTTGRGNTADGWSALKKNTTSYNTAIGYSALANNTTGGTLVGTEGGSGGFTDAGPNTAVGSFALANCTTASANVAVGYRALAQMTNVGASVIQNASANTAVGFKALENDNASAGQGVWNSAFGYEALLANTEGTGNNAFGRLALAQNTIGSGNTAFGDRALFMNMEGYANTAIGKNAGDLITGAFNIDIGAYVEGVAGESSVTRIGNIGDTPQNTAIYVTLDSVGGTKLGYVNVSSSRRYKQDIQPMSDTSEALFSLEPVNFRYKPEFDPDRAKRFGLIAEDVEKINPDLVAHNERGEVTTVRYECVNAMLLNEFLKEHRKIEQQDRQLRKQGAIIAKQQKQIEALTAGLQKVSDELELSKPAPHLVGNNQ